MNFQSNPIKIAIFPFLLVFFEMTTYLSSDMYLPALPTVMRYFALNHAQAQMTLTSWFLGAISVQLILGPIADRYGRKIVLCFGGILFTLATLACAITSDFHAFIVARFIQGMGICFMAVPGYAAIHELFEQAKAIKILALMGSITILAPALGPLLGSIILQFASWKWIFGFIAICSSSSIILLIIYMPETLPVAKRHPLKISKILSTYGKILSNFNFMLTVSIFGLIFCGFITWIAAGPFLVINQFHLTPMMFGLFQALIFVSNIIANNLVKFYIDKVGARKLIRIGLNICFGISIIALGTSWLLPNLLIGMIFIYIVYSFGSGLTFSPLNRLTVETSNEPMGSRIAVFSTFLSGFATLSSVLVSIFYDNSLLSLAEIIFAVMLIATLLNLILSKYSNP
jgi:DHA1 family multidrug/chloramphenicol efflux transport protein-like MFS transporter